MGASVLPGATTQIFISYSARTKEEAELSDCLVDLFANAFTLAPKAIFAYTAAGHGVKSGGHLLDELKLALASSQVVLSIATPAVAGSSYSQFEAAASDLAGKYSVPLLPDASFHSYVPAVFRDVAARSLTSLGEICQLLEDMRTPLGVPGVQPAALWISKAERVIVAAREVSGQPSADDQIESLNTRLAGSERWRSNLTIAAAVAALSLLIALAAIAVLWSRNTRYEQEIARIEQARKGLATDLAQANQTIEEINGRSQFLPAVEIEGSVKTTAGALVDNALVIACAVPPSASAAQPADASVCPEDLRLNAWTDSDGRFSLALDSLPPLRVGTAGRPTGLWLTAQHASKGRVAQRVKPVLERDLQLR